MEIPSLRAALTNPAPDISVGDKYAMSGDYLRSSIYSSTSSHKICEVRSARREKNGSLHFVRENLWSDVSPVLRGPLARDGGRRWPLVPALPRDATRGEVADARRSFATQVSLLRENDDFSPFRLTQLETKLGF